MNVNGNYDVRVNEAQSQERFGLQNVWYLQFSKTTNVVNFQFLRGRRGRDRMVVMLPMQSVPITTDVVSSNLDQGEVYNIMW